MSANPLLVVPFREVRHFRADDFLHCESIGVRAQQLDWTIPAHRHEGLHQFQLLTRGSMAITLDGERHALKAPAALMIAPGVVHGFVYEPGTAGNQVSVPSTALECLGAHSPDTAERLRQALVLDTASLGNDVAGCAALFDMLGDEFQAERAGRAEALQSYVVLLALWFLRREGAATARGKRQALRDTLVQRYRALVERNYREHRPLAFYAQALGVTPDHLSRVCRAATSTSALDLLHERLALEAKRLLVHTEHSVAEVALELGFEDAGYFSRFFKSSIGCAPSEFRRSIAMGTRSVPERGVGSGELVQVGDEGRGRL